MESFVFADLIDFKAFYNYVKKKITKEGRYYLLTDEIQEVEGWEKAVNALFVDFDIDIYLTDMKYRSSQMSAEYSGARDYFAVASEALREMISQTGGYKIKDGIMQSGVIVRHLILPMGYKDSISILDWLNGNISPKDYLLSLMTQYTPWYDAEKIPAINRRITTFEYRKVLSKAQEYGIDGFMQERASATLEMTPDWSDDGIDTD